MMAGFEIDNGKKIRECIEHVDSLHRKSASCGTVAPDDLQELKGD